MKRSPTLLLTIIGALALATLSVAYLARPDGASTAQDDPGAVSIQDYSFQPATLRIEAGDTVTWTNRDAVRHTVTGEDGDWTSGLLARGQSFSRTFTEPGTFEYYCEPHPNMQAKIVVGDTDDEEEGTQTPAPATAGGEASQTPPPDTPDDRSGQMRQMMDQMHGPGTFEAMRQWMEERWGSGAFEAMLQSCPHGAEGMTPGQSMMDGGGPMHGSGSGQGMMGPGGGMMGGGTTGPGGMMGGPQR